MFSNFVTFTEVVKLSPVIHYNLERLNFHKDILSSILQKNDLVNATSIFKLIEKEDFKKLMKFVELINLNTPTISRKWIKLITTTITIDKLKLYNIISYYEKRLEVFEATSYLFNFFVQYRINEDMKTQILTMFQELMD